MSARSWTVTIPAPTVWLNANRRSHWRQWAEDVKTWRHAAHVYAQQAKLPSLDRIHIGATLHFPDRRKRDAHNYYPTLKACVDGLVDYGLIADDSTEYLDGPDIRMGDHEPGANRLILTIREATRA